MIGGCAVFHWWDDALTAANRRFILTGRRWRVYWDVRAEVWRVKPAVIR